MPTDVRLYLRQLEADELNFLAKYIEAKIPKGITRNKLADILYSHHVTKQDILKVLSKPSGRTGIYAKYDGESYEKKVMNHFESQNYKCRLNERPSRGTEFDIIGERGKNYDTWASNKSIIVVECKNQPLVTNPDLQKFAGKFKGFKEEHEEEVSASLNWTSLVNKKPPIQGFMATSGIFEPLAREEKEKHIDIELIRLRF